MWELCLRIILLILGLTQKETKMFLIDDILLSPIKGLIYLGKKIDELVEREMSDEGLIKEKLMALQLQFEMDEIDETEYDKREAELLDLLEKIRTEKQIES